MPATRSSKKKSKKIIIITPGDPAGIGPEVTLKALANPRIKKKRSVEFLIIGKAELFKKLQSNKNIQLIDVPVEDAKSRGEVSGRSIEIATELLLSQKAHALVTGPISKSEINRAGYNFRGHTDFLEALTKSPPVTMMLYNSYLKVSLVTTHVSVHGISQNLSAKKIEQTFQNTFSALRSYWKIKKPKIAILGLNPHAGEEGLLGREELDTIIPTIESLSKKYANNATIKGPFSADTFFALETSKKSDRFDAVIAIYHDQGLIPVKLLDFRNTVNITLGLPFVRTSVDHGTALDIAGLGIADPSSMIAALEAAISIQEGI